MPSRTRIAIVGFGLIGRRHAEVVRRAPELALAAVVDQDQKSHAAAAALGASVYSSLPDMIEAEAPDGIVLATPTPLHIDQGLTCIDAGRPVLIEKPVAVTSTDARVLIDAANSADVPLLVGHHRRYNGTVRAAKAAIDAGAVGDIRAIQATCWFYKPDHYFEKAPWRRRKGAGPISVNLVHDVDLLRHFCGEVDAVQAVAVPSRRGFENEDLATAVLRFRIGRHRHDQRLGQHRCTLELGTDRTRKPSLSCNIGELLSHWRIGRRSVLAGSARMAARRRP